MGNDFEQKKDQLESMIQSIEKEQKSSGSSFFGVLSEKSAPPQPKSAPAVPSSQPIPPLMEKALQELLRRTKSLEEELSKEKERALSASLRLEEKESARNEMEKMFQELKDQTRREKMDRDAEQEKLNARSRVETLEKRLEEVNHLLLEIVKDQKKALMHGIPPDMMETLMNRQNEMIHLIKEKDEQITHLQKRTAEMVESAESYAAKRWNDEKKSLESTIHALQNESEMLKRQLELMKSSFAEIAARHDGLVNERKKMICELEESEVKVAYYRFEELSQEIEKLRKSASEFLDSSAPKASAELIRKLIEDKEKEYWVLKEKIQQIEDRSKTKPE